MGGTLRWFVARYLCATGSGHSADCHRAQSQFDWRDYIAGRHKRSVTFEYTLMDGINDHSEHAYKLVRLLKSVPSKLNLIPFNPFPGARYRCSPPDRIKRFQEIVMSKGQIAIVRKTRGEDIDAACGQLIGRVRDRTRRSERHRLRLAELQK